MTKLRAAQRRVDALTYLFIMHYSFVNMFPNIVYSAETFICLTPTEAFICIINRNAHFLASTIRFMN